MSDPVTEAKAAFDRWHDAFNARDSAAMVAEMNFPHVRLTAANRFHEWPAAEDFAASQDTLTPNLRAEGWHHTVNVSIDPVQVGADKVHFALRESRRDESDTEYEGFDTFWIFTNIDGHWGLQFRSSFLSTPGQGLAPDGTTAI